MSYILEIGPQIAYCPWDLVRRVRPGNQWHPSTDKLHGTDVYGNFVNNGAVDLTFSIAFNIEEVEDFLFITGDREKWLVASVDAVGGLRDANSNTFQGYSGEKRDIKMSSISSNPYQAIWYNRKGFTEDPWISLNDHFAAIEDGNILYAEANFNWPSHTKILSLHNGANVYIRKKGIFLSNIRQSEVFKLSKNYNNIAEFDITSYY